MKIGTHSRLKRKQLFKHCLSWDLNHCEKDATLSVCFTLHECWRYSTLTWRVSVDFVQMSFSVLKGEFMQVFWAWCEVGVIQTHQEHGRWKQEKEGSLSFPEMRKGIGQKLISAIWHSLERPWVMLAFFIFSVIQQVPKLLLLGFLITVLQSWKTYYIKVIISK